MTPTTSRRTKMTLAPPGAHANRRPQWRARHHRDRHREVLFIDARHIGHMATRTTKEFTDDDIAQVASTYHRWRGEPNGKPYEDVPGFCASVTLDQIGEHNNVLT